MLVVEPVLIAVLATVVPALLLPAPVLLAPLLPALLLPAPVLLAPVLPALVLETHCWFTMQVILCSMVYVL